MQNDGPDPLFGSATPPRSNRVALWRDEPQVVPILDLLERIDDPDIRRAMSDPRLDKFVRDSRVMKKLRRYNARRPGIDIIQHKHIRGTRPIRDNWRSPDDYANHWPILEDD